MRKSAKESSCAANKSSCARLFLSGEKSTYGRMRDAKFEMRRRGARSGCGLHGPSPVPVFIMTRGPGEGKKKVWNLFSTVREVGETGRGNEEAGACSGKSGEVRGGCIGWARRMTKGAPALDAAVRTGEFSFVFSWPCESSRARVPGFFAPAPQASLPEWWCPEARLRACCIRTGPAEPR